MRGVDHDTRRFELEFVPDGVRVGPARRSQPPELKTHGHTPIGVPGLDALSGGGLATGTGVLLEHDGYANLRALFGAVVHAALDRDAALFLVPTIRMRPSGFEAFLTDREERTADLLESDRLFVLDQIGGWDQTDRNVFAARESPEGVQSVLDVLADRSEDRPRLSMINADSMVNSLGPEAARTVRYWQEARMLRETDPMIHVHNPTVTAEGVSGFFTNAAEQVIRTWLSDDGLQYVTLEKSPCGFIGTTSLVEYTTDPPYLRVQHPPQERENPYAVEESPAGSSRSWTFPYGSSNSPSVPHGFSVGSPRNSTPAPRSRSYSASKSSVVNTRFTWSATCEPTRACFSGVSAAVRTIWGNSRSDGETVSHRPSMPPSSISTSSRTTSPSVPV
jgi:hypothetical protein